MSNRDYQKIVGIGTLASFVLGLGALAMALTDPANSNGWALTGFALLVGAILAMTIYSWFRKLSSFVKGNKKQPAPVLDQANVLSDNYVDPDGTSDDATPGDLEDLIPDSANRIAPGLALVLFGIPVALAIAFVAFMMTISDGGGVGTFVGLFVVLLIAAIWKVIGR